MASSRATLGELDNALLGASRVQEIEWTHPTLSTLSDGARLVYACLVDACSDEARETISGVDLVWRNRDAYITGATTTRERREAALRICSAVEELLDAGLLLLLDERTITGGWVRRPWEGVPS